MEDKTYPNGHVGIEFEVKEIKEFSETQMQLYGYIKKHAVIKCVFDEMDTDGQPQNFKFYLVENYGNTVKTPSIELLGDLDNEKVIKDIISQFNNLRTEAETNADSITDLSNFNLKGDLNVKPKKPYKTNKNEQPNQ